MASPIITKYKTIKIGYVPKYNIFLNHVLFCYLYFINGLLYTMPIPNIWFASKASKVFFLWGCALLAIDFMTQQIGMKAYNAKMLFIFILLELVSVIINFNGNLYRGIQDLIYNSIFFFILYSVLIDRTYDKQREIIYNFNNILIFILFVANIISIIMFFMKVSFSYEYRGIVYHIGIYSRRLSGIVGANSGSLLGILSVVASAVNKQIKNNRIFKWIYRSNILVQFIFLSLSGSRGGFVTLFVILGVYLLFYKYKRYKRTFYYIVPCVAIILFWLIVGAIGTYKCSTIIGEKLTEFANSTNNIISKEEQNSMFQIQKVTLEKAVDRSKREADITTGRKDMWTAALKVFPRYAVFGFSNARLVDQMGNVYVDLPKDYLNETDMKALKQANGYLHNNYIQILLSVGILGFWLIGIFIMAALIRWYKLIVSIDEMNQKLFLVLLFCVLIGLMVNCFFESHLLFHQGDSIGIIFWFYLGIVNILSKEKPLNNVR